MCISTTSTLFSVQKESWHTWVKQSIPPGVRHQSRQLLHIPPHSLPTAPQSVNETQHFMHCTLQTKLNATYTNTPAHARTHAHARNTYTHTHTHTHTHSHADTKPHLHARTHAHTGHACTYRHATRGECHSCKSAKPYSFCHPPLEGCASVQTEVRAGPTGII